MSGLHFGAECFGAGQPWCALTLSKGELKGTRPFNCAHGYAFYGDANLDGQVNLQDFNRLAANFGGSGKRSIHGEFTYDPNGAVNLLDFNRLASNFGAATDPATHEHYTYEELEEMLPD